MLYTLADARTACKKFVDAGSCNNAAIDARINEALERLLAEQPWEVLRRVVRIAVEGKCFALPWNTEKILWVDVDGDPVRVNNMAYQFMDAGPGDAEFRTTGGLYRDLEDLGDFWPTMYEVPRAFETDAGTEVGETGWRIGAFATTTAAGGSSLVLEGVTHDGLMVSETLELHQWAGGVAGQLRGTWGTSIGLSTNSYASLARVRLTAGRTAYVSLYAVDPDTNYMYFLAQYHPSQPSLPQFRRFRINNHSCEDEVNILALVQLRHVPLSLETDILPINSVQAVKLAVMAISKENAEDVDGAMKLMATAIRVLTKVQEANSLTGGVPQIMDSLKRTSLGHALNRRILL